MKKLLGLPFASPAVVTLVALLLLLAGLSRTPLARSTEPRVGGIATQMYLDHNYVLPQLNNQPFLEKPPLHAFLTALSFHAFGVNDFSARFVSVVAVVVTLLLVLAFLRRHEFAEPVAVLATLSLLTMAYYWSYGRLAGQDALLTLGVVLAALYTYEFSLGERWQPLAVVALGVAIAALTKGVFGIAVSTSVMFSYLVMKQWLVDRRFRFKPLFVLGVATLVGLIPLCLWLLALYHQAGWQAFYEVVWVNSVDRFKGTYQLGGHVEHWYYYIVRIPTLFQPWLALVLFGLYLAWKRARVETFNLFLVCWLLVPFVMLTLSSSKRSEYLLSLYPAAALLLANVYALIFRSETAARLGEFPKATRNLLVFQGVFSLGILVASLVMARKVHHVQVYWYGFAVIGLAGLGYAGYQLFQGNQRKFVAGNLLAVAMACVFYGTTYGIYESAQRSEAKVFEAARAAGVDAGAAVALYRPLERLSGGAVYYLQRTMPSLNTPQQVDEFIRQHPQSVVISEDEELTHHSGHLIKVMVKHDPYYLLQN